MAPPSQELEPPAIPGRFRLTDTKALTPRGVVEMSACREDSDGAVVERDRVRLRSYGYGSAFLLQL